MNFLDPGKLWALAIVPVLLAAYLLMQRRRRSYTMRFTNVELLASVAPRRPGWRRHVPPALMLLALVVLVGGLARPTMTRGVPREQSGIMLVMDVSLSMAATDVAPDRITAAKAAAVEFVRALPKELRVGVAAFSEVSGLAAPMTRSRSQAELAIASLRLGGGTAIGEGLHTALDEIERTKGPDGKTAEASVLMLSDGQWNRGRPPAEAAERAKAMGVKVFTVGLGTQGATLDLGGEAIPVDLDEDELRGIADTTGGSFFLTTDAESLRDVYRTLGSSLGTERERQEVTAMAVGIALLLLIAGAAVSLVWFQRIP